MSNLSPAPRRRPQIEPLEDRLVPAHIVVHNAADGAVMPIVGGVAPNLRSAIANSNSGDEIDLDNATYLLTNGQGLGELFVGHNLTIKNNAGGVSTINGQNQTRVFEISGQGTTVTMTGLKITGGNGNDAGEGGGILVDPGDALKLNQVTVTGNSADTPGGSSEGGGIANSGALTLNGCVISLNTVTGAGSVGLGGGVYQGQSASPLTVIATRFIQNTARGGGGGSTGAGGGLYVDANSAAVSVNGSTFSGNGAVGGASGGMAEGGGFYDVSGGLTTVTDSTFGGNTATGGAGGGGALGGGFYFDSETNNLSVDTSTFANNAVLGGAGVSSSVGDVDGGGLFLGSAGGGSTITRSTFASNRAVGGAASGAVVEGGGLFQANGPGGLSLFNSTFSGNSAHGAGGGLALIGIQFSDKTDGTDLLVNDTIARNSAARGGGLYAEPGEGQPPQQVWNTIIALNTAPIGPDIFENAGLISLGHNLVGSTAGFIGPTDLSAAKHDLLNLTAAQINLGPLASNGGPTQTIALLPGSVAIDAGDDAVLTDPRTRFTSDQRGYPRKTGAHVDIGAFEFQPPPSHRRGRRNGPT